MIVERLGRPWKRPVVLLLVCIGAFFLHLGRAEVNLMEARNFVAAREMAAGGSWLIPTMNGALRLAKPPLPTWASAAVVQLTQQPANPFWLRVPAAVLATLLVFFFWGLMRELTCTRPGETEAPGRTAWLAALVLATSLLTITVGREGHWDVFANSLLMGCLWALSRAWHAEQSSWRWFGLSGLLLMAVVGLAVGLAWPIYLSVQNDVAPAALAVARLEATSWVERHSRPFWDYWNFPVFAGIWTPVALAALAVPFARPRAGRYVPYAAGLAWLLIALLLLSVVPEKKERYMLPLMPPLALLMSGLLRHFETAWQQHPTPPLETRLLRIWAGLLALIFVLIPVALGLAKLPDFAPGTPVFTLVSMVFWALAAGVAWRLKRALGPTALVNVSLAAMLALLILLLPAHAAWINRRADPGLRRAEQLQHNPVLAGIPWYTFEELHIKEVWRAGRATPSWPRTPDSALERPTGPVAVLTGANVAEQLPAAWRNRVSLQVVDSFYLDRQRKDGYWRVTVVRPLP